MIWEPIPPVLAYSLVTLAQEEFPLEACGFILDNASYLPLRNTHRRPLHNFEFDPDEQIAVQTKWQERITGVWHSHPHGARNRHRPSHSDLEFPYAWRYFIVTLHDVYEWRIVDGSASPVVPSTGETGSHKLAYPILGCSAQVRS